MELQLPRDVVAGCEFERGLSSNIDADKGIMGFIGVVNGGRGRGIGVGGGHYDGWRREKKKKKHG